MNSDHHCESRLPLVPLAAFLLIFPWFLSRKNRVVRRAIVPAPIDSVFPLINDLHLWPGWTEWSRREPVDFTFEGSAAGTGAIQRWRSGGMSGRVEITQSVPNDHIAYANEIVRSGKGKHQFDGIFAFEPLGNSATRVTWYCHWEGDANPYSRYYDLMLKWMIGRDFQAGLNNLAEMAARQTR